MMDDKVFDKVKRKTNVDKDTIIVPEKCLDGEVVSIDIFKNVKG